MKRMGLGSVLALAALSLTTSPVMAAPGVQPPARVLSAADQAFLASLALPDPAPAAKRPIRKAIEVCAVNCDGTSVSCSGLICSGIDRNCATGEPGHVTCDGVTTWCPDTCIDCDALEQQCSSECSPCAYNFTCDPATQDWRCHCNLRGCPQ